jgi:hypothetical protein
MSESSTSARKVLGKERTAQALELRKAGLTYRQIGERLGFTEQGAHICVTRALERIGKLAADEVEAVRLLEIERLDRMLAAIWGQVLNGNFGAIDRALRIQERRARLQGLDAAAKHDITTDGQPISIVRIGVDTEGV